MAKKMPDGVGLTLEQVENLSFQAKTEVVAVWRFVNMHLGTKADSLMYPVIWAFGCFIRAMAKWHRYTGRPGFMSAILRGWADYLEFRQRKQEAGEDVLEKIPDYLADYGARTPHTTLFKNLVGPHFDGIKAAVNGALALEHLDKKLKKLEKKS